MKDNNVNLDSIQKNKKTNIDFNMKEPQSDLKILNDIYNSKPDIKKFNIEGFNLKTINKSSVASKIEKDVFAPNEMNKTEKTNKKFFRNAFENLNPKEVDFSNFKIIFDRAIKNLIYNYQYEIDKKISEYVFKKLYFLEYLNCLR